MALPSVSRSPVTRIAALAAVGLGLVAGGTWLGSSGLPQPGGSRPAPASATARPAGLSSPGVADVVAPAQEETAVAPPAVVVPASITPTAAPRPAPGGGTPSPQPPRQTILGIPVPVALPSPVDGLVDQVNATVEHVTGVAPGVVPTPAL